MYLHSWDELKNVLVLVANLIEESVMMMLILSYLVQRDSMNDKWMNSYNHL